MSIFFAAKGREEAHAVRAINHEDGEDAGSPEKDDAGCHNMSIRILSAKKKDGSMIAKVSAEGNVLWSKHKLVVPLSQLQSVDWSAHSGGNVEICVKERDSFLLMAVEGCSPLAGTGARLLSNSNGSDGKKGEFKIQVTSKDNSKKNYGARYELVMASVNEKKLSANSSDGKSTLEFGETVVIPEVQITNVGRMPKPTQRIEICLGDQSKNLVFDGKKRLFLSSKVNLTPLETATADRGGLVYTAVKPDHSSFGDDYGPIEMTAVRHLQAFQLGPEFKASGDSKRRSDFRKEYTNFDGESGQSYRICYPVQNTTGISGLKVLSMGETANIKFAIRNTSTAALGHKSESKRKLVLRYSLSQSEENDMNPKQIQLYRKRASRKSKQLAIHRISARGDGLDGHLVNIRRLEPGQQKEIVHLLKLTKKVEPFTKATLQAEILLGELPTLRLSGKARNSGRLTVVQRRGFEVTCVPAFRNRTNTNVVLVTSSSTTREQASSWMNTLTKVLDLKVDVYSLSLYGHLDPLLDVAYKSGSKQKTTKLRDALISKLVIVLNDDYRHVAGGDTAEICRPSSIMSRPMDFHPSTRWLLVGGDTESIQHLSYVACAISLEKQNGNAGDGQHSAPDSTEQTTEPTESEVSLEEPMAAAKKGLENVNAKGTIVPKRAQRASRKQQRPAETPKAKPKRDTKRERGVDRTQSSNVKSDTNASASTVNTSASTLRHMSQTTETIQALAGIVGPSLNDTSTPPVKDRAQVPAQELDSVPTKKANTEAATGDKPQKKAMQGARKTTKEGKPRPKKSTGNKTAAPSLSTISSDSTKPFSATPFKSVELSKSDALSTDNMAKHDNIKGFKKWFGASPIAQKQSTEVNEVTVKCRSVAVPSRQEVQAILQKHADRLQKWLQSENPTRVYVIVVHAAPRPIKLSDGVVSTWTLGSLHIHSSPVRRMSRVLIVADGGVEDTKPLNTKETIHSKAMLYSVISALDSSLKVRCLCEKLRSLATQQDGDPVQADLVAVIQDSLTSDFLLEVNLLQPSRVPSDKDFTELCTPTLEALMSGPQMRELLADATDDDKLRSILENQLSSLLASFEAIKSHACRKGSQEILNDSIERLGRVWWFFIRNDVIRTKKRVLEQSVKTQLQRDGRSTIWWTSAQWHEAALHILSPKNKERYPSPFGLNILRQDELGSVGKSDTRRAKSQWSKRSPNVIVNTSDLAKIESKYRENKRLGEHLGQCHAKERSTFLIIQ